MVKQRANNEGSSLTSDKRPFFFKIIFSGHVERLRIPPLFMKHISKDMTKMATLKGPFGGDWHVKLHQGVDGTYLQDGWQDFSRDHSLGNFEFLLFRYDGKMSFNVMIFDKSGCERTNGREKGCRKRGSAIDSPRRDEKKSWKGFREESSEKHVETEDSEFEETDLQRTNSNKNKRPVCMAPLVEKLKTRDSKSAETFTSKFPFFIMCLRKYNVDTVFILKMPKSFSEHLCQGKMVLRNSEGKSWMVNTVLGADKAHAFSGGWKAFARDNLLKEGDSCVFELVEKNEMHVHIYRSNK